LIIVVSDVQPSISSGNLVPSKATIAEGDSITLSGSFVDPNPTHSAVVSIDWGDGSLPSTQDVPVGVRTFTSDPHQYVDNPTGGGTYSITVTVTTSDGQSASASTPVTVTNVNPTLTGITLSASAINEGDNVTLGGTIVDPGALDSHSVII